MLGQAFSFTAGESTGQININASRFWQEYAYRSDREVLALRSTFTRAHNNLNDTAVFPPATGGFLAENQYQLWLGQAQYARQLLDNSAQLILRATQQQTEHVLTTLDRMSIGGISTVRGYLENQLIRDRGTVINIEFDYPLHRSSGKGLNVSLIPFYDHGFGNNQHEAVNTVSSAGLNLRVRYQGLFLDFVIAKRLAHSNDISTEGSTLQAKGMHIQLGYEFY